MKFEPVRELLGQEEQASIEKTNRTNSTLMLLVEISLYERTQTKGVTNHFLAILPIKKHTNSDKQQ
jgi:hypothetical protein